MAKRVEIQKTFKLYIGGKFSRTESGRYFKAVNAKGETLANLCWASRKDLRNAVSAATKAQSAWSELSAYNRAQILYRIAENLESRKAELEALLVSERGLTKAKASIEVGLGIDKIVYYAGWADKYSAIFSSVNPVASSHFNFSIVEAVGTVGILADQDLSFSNLIAAIASIVVGGNSLLIVVPEKLSMSFMTFAEVIHHSDVPAGLINILTGYTDELMEHMAGHMEVGSLLYYGSDQKKIQRLEELSETNLKRCVYWSPKDQKLEKSPYSIYDFQEVKTTWHPIEQIGGASAAY